MSMGNFEQWDIWWLESRKAPLSKKQAGCGCGRGKEGLASEEKGKHYVAELHQPIKPMLRLVIGDQIDHLHGGGFASAETVLGNTSPQLFTIVNKTREQWWWYPGQAGTTFPHWPLRKVPQDTYFSLACVSVTFWLQSILWELWKEERKWTIFCPNWFLWCIVEK